MPGLREEDCNLRRNREYLERVIDERDRIYEERFRALEKLVEDRGKAMEKLIDERDRLYVSRFEAAAVAVNAALAAQEKSVNAAFAASEKAIVKAEAAQKDYNERTNEFRGQLSDQASTLMPRPETLSKFQAIEEKIASVQLGSKSDLETTRASFDKAITNIDSQISSLRDSRSSYGGREGAQRESVLHKQWSTGVLVAAVIATLALIISAISLVTRAVSK